MFKPGIDPSLVEVEELSKAYDFSLFDCEDKDLNEFLKEDALRYRDQLISKTFIVFYKEQVVAFFSVMNDSIKLNAQETQRTFNLMRLHEYPALKIGRLAVDKNHQKEGFGSFIIGFVIGLGRAANENSACRFITVDSYPQSIQFYEKQGFIANLMYEKKTHFISMRLDLLQNKEA